VLCLSLKAGAKIDTISKLTKHFLKIYPNNFLSTFLIPDPEWIYEKEILKKKDH
jgi:hypothetical protein